MVIPLSDYRLCYLCLVTHELLRPCISPHVLNQNQSAEAPVLEPAPSVAGSILSVGYEGNRVDISQVALGWLPHRFGNFCWAYAILCQTEISVDPLFPRCPSRLYISNIRGTLRRFSSTVVGNTSRGSSYDRPMTVSDLF